MSKIKVLELFGGIGACTSALKRLGVDHEVVDYVEIDKYAVKSYNAINDRDFKPQDITEWNKDIDVDLVMHGSPCQDFSLAGKGVGGDKDSGTRSSLMYETLRIVKNLRPKYVIWENVKNVLGKKNIHNFENYLNELSELGYKNFHKVLNAKDYGIPQNRERVFVISTLEDIDFVFPEKEELKINLSHLLEDSVNEKFHLSTQIFNNRTICLNSKGGRGGVDGLQPSVQDRIYSDQGVSTAITTSFMPNICVTKYNQTLNLTSKSKRLAKLAKTLDISKTQSMDMYNQSTKDDYIHTITTRVDAGNLTAVTHNSRIRKLTPKECWRLMGFRDTDFDKAQQVNSNAQLYKQAGNSIVVDVLYKIFKNLL